MGRCFDLVEGSSHARPLEYLFMIRLSVQWGLSAPCYPAERVQTYIRTNKDLFLSVAGTGGYFLKSGYAYSIPEMEDAKNQPLDRGASGVF